MHDKSWIKRRKEKEELKKEACAPSGHAACTHQFINDAGPLEQFCIYEHSTCAWSSPAHEEQDDARPSACLMCAVVSCAQIQSSKFQLCALGAHPSCAEVLGARGPTVADSLDFISLSLISAALFGQKYP